MRRRKRPKARSTSPAGCAPRRPSAGGEFAPLFAEAQEAISRTFEYAGPGLPGLHPRRRALHRRARRLPRAGREPLRGAVAAEPRRSCRSRRTSRGGCAICSISPLRRLTGAADVRRVDGEPLGGRDGAPREARRGLPRRHLLRDRAGARLSIHEGGDDRRVRRAERAARAHGRRAADGSGRARDAWWRRTAPPASVRSWWRRRRAPRTRARSTRSTRSPTIAEREGLWFHVDAAYGGFFQLTDRGRERVPRASSGPTRSPSTRTRVCSCRTAPAA